MFTDEGGILNYIGVNIKKKSDGTFKLLQYYLVEKIFNHVGITVSMSLKAIETPDRKLLLHKEKSIIVSKCVCNYRAEVGMLIYIQGYKRP